VSAPGYRKKIAAKIQIAGLFASSRQEEDDAEVAEEVDEEDDGEDPAGVTEDVAAGVAEEVAAAGKGRLRIANASSTRNSATDPRKNGSNLCAAVHATISEQNTAPTPQKKFSRLTALARELAWELL